MNYETFLKEKQRMEDLPVQDQKDFYERILKEEQEESSIRLQAYLAYASIFYYEGNFRKAREILEPFAISYQSYAYIPEMISCFNLMGVASQCEGEYFLSRYFYTVALKIIEEQNAVEYYAYEYNNISLTYIFEHHYNLALDYIQLAEKWLPQSEKKMGAYIYLNKSDIYNHLDRPDEAVEAYEICIHRYDGAEILPYDILICGITLYYRLGDQEKYQEYVQRVLDNLGDMHASEFIDACQTIFRCSLDSNNYLLAKDIMEKMDSYMQNHPHENKVGLKIEQLKYDYAQKIGDKDAMLSALEKKNYYYEKIVSRLEQQRATSMNEYLETHRHLLDAMQSETRANRAKTNFLSNMSHDIRTPLNGIIGLLEIDSAHFDDTDLIQSNHEKMMISANHLLSLINDVLQMSKLEDGTVTLSHEPIDLVELTKDIVTIVIDRAVEAGLYWDYEKGKSVIPYRYIYGSPLHLRQIFLNIYGNCIKYNRPGGKVTTIVHSLGDKNGVCTYRWIISDTGMGMSPEFLQHIFEPFAQEKDDARSIYHGTGLGMSIVKNLIDLMGGYIFVTSTEGEGSTFMIDIPFEIASEEAVQPAADDLSEYNIQGLRLLLAEDNQLNAEILETLLADRGARVITVSNGQQAVEKFQANQPGTFDAILMDVMMPVMDGLTATRTIRALDRPDATNIPIIAMTANAFQEDAKECLAAGMNAHLAKPLQITDVVSVISRYCFSPENTNSTI